MSIPRQIGPETGPRRALPDFSRSTATIERMVRDLTGEPAAVTGQETMITALVPAGGMRDALLRAAIAAVLLGSALIPGAVMLLLWLGIDQGRSPGLALLLVMLALGAMSLLLTLLGIRFALVAHTTTRARVEVTDSGLRIVGAAGSRFVAWHDIVAVESRVVRPVHWLTAALRLQDGSQVVMPAFDRHIWHCTSPSGQDIRYLRRELRRRGPDRPGRIRRSGPG